MKKQQFKAFDFIILSILLVIGIAGIVFGKILDVSASFRAGFFTGVVIGIAFLVVSAVKARKSIKDLDDERQKYIKTNAGHVSFGMSVLLLSVLAFITKSPKVAIPLALNDVFVLMMLFMIIVYFVAYIILSKLR